MPVTEAGRDTGDTKAGFTPSFSVEQLAGFPPFEERAPQEYWCTQDRLATLQMNIISTCNLACRHCHVESSPARREQMSQQIMAQCLELYQARGFEVMDITGGAPEMNPHLPWLLEEASSLPGTRMVRSNVCIWETPGYERFPELFARLGVTLVASLPHYTKKAAEKQRGVQSFDPIIRGLRRLNSLGYGVEGGLELDLVYNPGGAFMPGDQAGLERDYKRRLKQDFGIEFSHLFAIANNPLGRFGALLARTGHLDSYMTKLISGFNIATVPTMMCRSQVSVGWDGRVYDCDFNQAARMPCAGGTLTVASYLADPDKPLKRRIRFANHCYACCAGAGSSCGGATAE